MHTKQILTLPNACHHSGSLWYTMETKKAKSPRSTKIYSGRSFFVSMST